MGLKLCTKCSEDKEKSFNFSKNKTNKDGLADWCKSCYKEYMHQYYIDNKKDIIQKHIEYQRTDTGRVAHARWGKKYSNTEKGKESSRRTRANYRKKHPGETRARIMANRIPLESCQYPNCSSGEKAERHHWDYSKPLEVVFLRRKHHRLADRVKTIIDNKI